MIIKALILSFLISTVSGKTEFEECLLDNSGFLLTKDICLPSNYKTIAAGVNKVVKPIVRLSSLIELNKKFTSLSAIFDIYFIWKDDNLIANASSSNAVFFFNWFFSIETKKDHVKLSWFPPKKRWIVILKMPYLKNFKKPSEQHGQAMSN